MIQKGSNKAMNPQLLQTRYPHEFKRRVVLYAEKFSNREAERKFGISESNIRRWKKLRPILFSKAFVSDNGRRKRIVKRVSSTSATGYRYEIENIVDDNDKVMGMGFCFCLITNNGNVYFCRNAETC